MARTTATLVKDVIDVIDPADTLATFITFAGTITDRAEATAISNGLTLTTAQLLFIETYLAAHLYALKHPQVQKSRTGRSSETYQGKTGTGLLSTFWGQAALEMDNTGSLVSVTDSGFGGGGDNGPPISVGATWLGT